MQKLNEIKYINDPYDKLLKFMSLLNSEVKAIMPSAKPVIVGGSAVLIYTLGGQLTRDIDLIVNKIEEEALIKVLTNFGFKKDIGNRYWYNDELEIVLEFPSGDLAGSMEKLTEISVDGFEVYVIGIEDLLIDRLNAAKFWKDTRDFEQSAILLKAYGNKAIFDWAYLEEKAKENNLLDTLEELKTKIQDIK